MKQKIAIFLIFLCVTATGISCNLLDVIMASMDEDATQTAVSRQKTVDAIAVDLAGTATEDAYQVQLGNRENTAVAQKTKDAAIPVILAISFPSMIANDRREIPGTVEFYDEGGDANTLKFDVLEGSFNPSQYRTRLVSGDKYHGKLAFNIWCEGLQTIKLQIQVIDDHENTSDPMTITYSCVDPKDLPKPAN
jgi:hypothetical protein